MQYFVKNLKIHKYPVPSNCKVFHTGQRLHNSPPCGYEKCDDCLITEKRVGFSWIDDIRRADLWRDEVFEASEVACNTSEHVNTLYSEFAEVYSAERESRDYSSDEAEKFNKLTYVIDKLQSDKKEVSEKLDKAREAKSRVIKRVFISSTRKDLEKERKQVLKAISYLPYQPVAMEYFIANPRVSIEVCLEKVRKSDVYVGIVAHRYGQIVKRTGLSYTQMEYDEAWKKNLPCLIYIISDDCKILPKSMEKNPESIRKLNEFKSILKKRHTPSYFNDVNELTIKVVIGLMGARA